MRTIKTRLELLERMKAAQPERPYADVSDAELLDLARRIAQSPTGDLALDAMARSIAEAHAGAA